MCLQKMLQFLTKFNIITNQQPTSHFDRDTESACNSFLKYIHNHLDQKMYVGALFFDLSKVFDSINIIIGMLRIQVSFLSWISSCLTSCNILSKQTVVNRNTGVPQWSILCSSIFLVYVNDLPRYISAYHIILYAVDSIITRHAKFISWCNKNSLIINCNKIINVHFFSKKNNN